MTGVEVYSSPRHPLNARSGPPALRAFGRPDVRGPWGAGATVSSEPRSVGFLTGGPDSLRAMVLIAKVDRRERDAHQRTPTLAATDGH